MLNEKTYSKREQHRAAKVRTVDCQHPACFQPDGMISDIMHIHIKRRKSAAEGCKTTDTLTSKGRRKNKSTSRAAISLTTFPEMILHLKNIITFFRKAGDVYVCMEVIWTIKTCILTQNHQSLLMRNISPVRGLGKCQMQK